MTCWWTHTEEEPTPICYSASLTASPLTTVYLQNHGLCTIHGPAPWLFVNGPRLTYLPRDTSAEFPKNAVDELAVILPLKTSPVHQQQRFNLSSDLSANSSRPSIEKNPKLINNEHTKQSPRPYLQPPNHLIHPPHFPRWGLSDSPPIGSRHLGVTFATTLINIGALVKGGGSSCCCYC